MDVIIAKSKTHKISHLVAGPIHDPNYNKRRKCDLESYEKINNIEEDTFYQLCAAVAQNN